MQEQIRESRQETTLQTDEALLKFLREKPGALSMYQLAQEIGWSVGKVQKSADRLLKKGLISYKRLLLGGRYLKLIIAASEQQEKQATQTNGKLSGVLAVPIGIEGSKLWTNNAFLYALNALSFGISNSSVQEWREQALFEVQLSLQKERDSLCVRLPEKVAAFYVLSDANLEFSISPKKDKIVVAVSRPSVS